MPNSRAVINSNWLKDQCRIANTNITGFYGVSKKQLTKRYQEKRDEMLAEFAERVRKPDSIFRRWKVTRCFVSAFDNVTDEALFAKFKTLWSAKFGYVKHISTLYDINDLDRAYKESMKELDVEECDNLEFIGGLLQLVLVSKQCVTNDITLTASDAYRLRHWQTVNFGWTPAGKCKDAPYKGEAVFGICSVCEGTALIRAEDDGVMCLNCDCKMHDKENRDKVE